MPRGGKRKNAGRPSTWASGCTREDTIPIRVPKSIKDKVWDYAHRLDSGENLDCVVKSLKEENIRLESRISELEKSLNQPMQMDLFGASVSSPVLDKNKLYRLRDKVLAKGVGKYASTSPIVKDVKKKFTEFIKIVVSGNYD